MEKNYLYSHRIYKDYYEYEPKLHYFKNNNQEIYDKLLYQCDIFLNSLLHIFIECDDIEGFKALYCFLNDLKLSNNPSNIKFVKKVINLQNINGDTAAHIAARKSKGENNNYTMIIELLENLGADLTIPNKNNEVLKKISENNYNKEIKKIKTNIKDCLFINNESNPLDDIDQFDDSVSSSVLIFNDNNSLSQLFNGMPMTPIHHFQTPNSLENISSDYIKQHDRNTSDTSELDQIKKKIEYVLNKEKKKTESDTSDDEMLIQKLKKSVPDIKDKIVSSVSNANELFLKKLKQIRDKSPPRIEDKIVSSVPDIKDKIVSAIKNLKKGRDSDKSPPRIEDRIVLSDTSDKDMRIDTIKKKISEKTTPITDKIKSSAKDLFLRSMRSNMKTPQNGGFDIKQIFDKVKNRLENIYILGSMNTEYIWKGQINALKYLLTDINDKYIGNPNDKATC
jgi:hypothetical protein